MNLYTRLIFPLLITLILGFTKIYFGEDTKVWEGVFFLFAVGQYNPYYLRVHMACQWLANNSGGSWKFFAFLWNPSQFLPK
jgi:hypothetical protein